jgi:cholesterol transport system auxiliary component
MKWTLASVFAARILGVIGLSTSLLACSGSLFESKAPVPQVYVLAATSFPMEGESSNADIAIGMPSAAPGLDTERIAVLRAANLLDYYAGATWGDTAPHIMQYFLVNSLQRSDKFHSVTTEQARIAADYLLDVDLQDFQAEYAGASAPAVRVGITVSLTRIKDRKLIGNWRFSATTAASDNRLGAVVAAFQAASQQVVAQVGANATETIVRTRAR